MLLPLIAGLAYWLNVEGARAVLESNGGSEVSVISDPDAPGYQAFAEPTETMLVVHVADDELVGLSLLAETIPGQGGQVVVFPVDLASDGPTSPTLAELFADQGSTAVADRVSAMVGFGILDVIELPSESLRDYFEPIDPLLVQLVDDLVTTDEVGDRQLWLSAGVNRLDGADLAQLFGFRNPQEADVNRTERQQDLWQRWLAGVETTDNLDQTVYGFSAGLPRMIRVLGTGQSAVDAVPVAPTSQTGNQLSYELTEASTQWLSELARRMIALPVAPSDQSWPTVRLLNSTGTPETLDAAIDALSWEAELVVIGNTESFGQATTTVAYHRDGAQRGAEMLAGLLGATVIAELGDDEPVDVTVTIGAEWSPK